MARLMENGTRAAQAVEQLGDFELVDLVHRNVAHRLKAPMGPDRTSQSMDAPSFAVEKREFEPVKEPRAARRQTLGALDDQAPGGDVDHPTFVGKAVDVLNHRQIYLPPQAQATFHLHSSETSHEGVSLRQANRDRPPAKGPT